MASIRAYEKCGFSSEKELADYIKSQNELGKDLRQLQNELHIGYSSIRRTINKFKIKTIVGHGYLNHGFKTEQEFINHLNELYKTNTMPEIAIKLGVSTHTVQNHYFPKFKIKKRKFNESSFLKTKPANLTKIESEIINGMLLGDGSLYINKKFEFKNAVLLYTCHYIEVLDDIRYNLLKKLGWHFKIVSRFDKRTNKTYTNYTICSRSFPELTELKKKWYPNGIKIIPKDIILTPETCYWWYLGDGSSGNSSLILCTNGFTEKDVKFIANKIPVECAVYTTQGPMINIIKRKERRKFLDFIGPCRHKCYSKRWIINNKYMKPDENFN